ncbi:MAG: NUDIX domain-containing protein [Anaerolineae bacterium]|nr:NUDIX domain-containing protein [Anaerolineae bacterium]
MTTPRMVQGSVIFVLDDNAQVLLLQRNHPPFEGKWDGLQGVVEFGETPEQAARRETTEESGLVLDTCDHRAHLLLYNTERPLTISTELFVATVDHGTLRGSREGLPTWVALDKIPQTDLLGFMHITLPLILMPHTLLLGTIRHTNTGAPVSYDLAHHQIGETTVFSKTV